MRLLVAVVVVGMVVGVGVRARSTSQSCRQSQGRDRRSQSLGVLYRIATFAQVTVAAGASTPGVRYIVVLDEVSKVPGRRTVIQC